MAKHRLVDTHFWDDGYIVGLNPSEKYLYLYLITNSLTNIVGIYELPLRRAAFDTGLDENAIKIMLDKFQHDNKIAYREGWVGIANFEKHQLLRGDKLDAAKKTITERIPDSLSIALKALYNNKLEYKSNSNSSIKDSGTVVKKETQKDKDEEVVSYFYEVFESSPKQKYLEVKYARELHKQHGVEKAKKLVDAAALVRGQQYAPSIYSVKDLHFKQDNLADFYRRSQNKPPNMINI